MQAEREVKELKAALRVAKLEATGAGADKRGLQARVGQASRDLKDAQAALQVGARAGWVEVSRSLPLSLSCLDF